MQGTEDSRVNETESLPLGSSHLSDLIDLTTRVSDARQTKVINGDEGKAVLDKMVRKGLLEKQQWSRVR